MAGACCNGSTPRSRKRYPGQDHDRRRSCRTTSGSPRMSEQAGPDSARQWDANFVHPIRQVVIAPDDEQRSLGAVRDALCYRYNDDAFDRVIYSESHDEVASGKARVAAGGEPGTIPRAGTRRSARRWRRRWSSPRRASPCSSRGRNSSKAAGSATRSRSTGISATSSTASSGSTATSSGCGSTAKA